MKRSKLLALVVLGLCATVIRPSPLFAMDPPSYKSPFPERIETLNFPLLAMIKAVPVWSAALRADPAMRKLAADRAARVENAAACASRPECLAAAWVWTSEDIATVASSLRVLADKPGLASALVGRHLRPSGRFARHQALGDVEFLLAAWTDTASGLNNAIAVYAQGRSPRYPKIDAIIFDTKQPEFAAVLGAHAQVTAAAATDDDIVFDPSLRFVAGLLRMNERTDASAFRPLLAGENSAAVAAVKKTLWSQHRYPALLVFGHGPEDAQSRTGVMGYIRLARTADLFARGLAPFIIVSGGNVHPNRTPFNEAIEMKRVLVEQYGVPADRILIEPHARHTTTNLRNCARLLIAAGFPAERSSLIVTDPMTVNYIGSPILLERTVKETGVMPGQLAGSATPFAFEFRPDAAAFHVEPLDPLDP